MDSRIGLALAILFAVSSAARGQEQRITAVNPDSALQAILADIDGTRLTLHDAVHLGLDNATSVRTAEAVYRSAEGAARRESGAFDPSLFFSFNMTTQDQPTASFFSGANVLSTTQTNSAGGLRMSLPTGTQLEASLNTLSLETNSTFANLNPQYTAFGSVSLRQPLLKGFMASGNKYSAKADRELEAAKARYDQEVLATTTVVEQGYWDLYAAERDYAVQRLTRDRAEAFLRETETRAKTGLIGPNQVANARTFLAEQEILLLDREEELDRLSDTFSSVIGKRPDAGKPRLLPTDNPPDDFPVDDVDVLVATTLENNFQLKAAKSDVEARRTLSNAAFWEALPSVDLVASLGANGLSGAARDVVFNTDTLRTQNGGKFAQSLNQVFRRQFPLWSVGVEINIPIGLRSGIGERDRLEADVSIAEQREIQQARLLEEEVRSSYRELLNGKRRLTVAREGVDAAQEQIRIGLIEFQNGRSTAFELVRLGADFAVAQQRYSQALVRSAKAAANMRQLTSGYYTTTR